MVKAFSVFILFITSQFLAGLISLMMVNWDNIVKGQGIDWLRAGEVAPATLGVSTFIAYLLLITLLWLLRLMSERPFQNFARPFLRSYAGLLAAFVFGAFGVSMLLHPFQLDDLGHLTQLYQMLGSWPSLLLICVLGPVIEEVVFRDGIQRHLTADGMRPWLAIVISAATFAVIHMNMAQAVPAFILGIGLGWLYQKTGDMRLCVPAHIMNNTLAVVTVKFTYIDSAMQQLPVAAGIAAGGALVVAAVWLFYKFYRQ